MIYPFIQNAATRLQRKASKDGPLKGRVRHRAAPHVTLCRQRTSSRAGNCVERPLRVVSEDSRPWMVCKQTRGCKGFELRGRMYTHRLSYVCTKTFRVMNKLTTGPSGFMAMVVALEREMEDDAPGAVCGCVVAVLCVLARMRLVSRKLAHVRGSAPRPRPFVEHSRRGAARPARTTRARAWRDRPRM